MSRLLSRLLLSALLVSLTLPVAYSSGLIASPNEELSKRMAFHDAMRKLWEEHQQILHMADMLSEGIMKQFPEKFK